MNPEDFHWAAQRQGDLLLIHFKDREAHSNSCSLTVHKFEYFSLLESLSVSLERDSCPYDFLNHTQGVYGWQLPFHLRRGGQVHLFLDHHWVGTVELKGESAHLRLKNAEGEM